MIAGGSERGGVAAGLATGLLLGLATDVEIGGKVGLSLSSKGNSYTTTSFRRFFFFFFRFFTVPPTRTIGGSVFSHALNDMLLSRRRQEMEDVLCVMIRSPCNSLHPQPFIHIHEDALEVQKYTVDY